MVILTDQQTFVIVAFGVFVVLGILASAYGLTSFFHEKSLRKLDVAQRNVRDVLDKVKADMIPVIEKNRSVFSQMDVEQFVEANREFLNSCISYSQSKGLDRYAAIEDTVIYARDIFRAYAGVCTISVSVEEYTELVSKVVRETLQLESLEDEKRNLLRGGLSNPV